MSDLSHEETTAEQGHGAPEAGYWQPVDVEIVTQYGTRAVRGLSHPRAPGLAVTPSPGRFGTWTVTHIKSGRKVGGEFERCSNACLCLARLAYCCDWTLDGEAVGAYVREHGDEPANAPGCTTTHMGETKPTSKRDLISSERNHFWFDEFPWEEESPQHRANTLLLGLPEPTSEVAPAPSSLPALSATRVEEIQRIREQVHAIGAPIQHLAGDRDACPRCRISYALDDLLAEVRRLQSALSTERERADRAGHPFNATEKLVDLARAIAEEHPNPIEARHE